MYQVQAALAKVISRSTAQFRIVQSTGEGVKLVLKRVLPVSTQDTFVVAEVAGPGRRSASEILSALTVTIVVELSNAKFYLSIVRACHMVSKEFEM